MCAGRGSQELYAAVAQRLGWREVLTGSSPGNSSAAYKKARPSIYCVASTLELTRLDMLPLPPMCWATRYLGTPDLCDKGNWARVVRLCQDVAADGTFDFNPPTWLLPDQAADLRTALLAADHPVRTVIIKPEDGQQGDGIFLARTSRELHAGRCNNSPKVAQQYLERPLLIGGFKFDFRVYAVLIGGSASSPPRTFICKEGLARFCAERYKAPTARNLHKSMSHLTNYSLNKQSDLFEHSGETVEEVFSVDSSSSKRPLTVVLEQISQEFPDFDPAAFYARLADMVRTAVAIFAPALANAGRGKHGAPGSEMRSCQVLGFDVLLDGERTPYLLEVNSSPSLSIDEAIPLDAEEEAAFLESVAGQARSTEKVRTEGAICRCSDMPQPHRHRTSVVDLTVKRSVVADMFGLLQRFNAVGIDGDVEVPDSMLEVSVREDPVYDLMERVNALFQRAGGDAKVFTATGLRRAFQTLVGRSSLQTPDLDIMSVKSRQTNFTSRDPAATTETLRVFDFLKLLTLASAKAFPRESARVGVQLALAALGV